MKKAAVTFLFLLVFSAGAFATEDVKKVITGKVTDKESHESLAGVKVSVEGTTISTYTDMNGNYTLFIPQNAEVKISYSLVSYERNVIPSLSSVSSAEILLSPSE